MKLFFALIGLISCLPLEGQIKARLSIDNAYAVGTDFFFDIYIRRISPEEDGNIYLAYTDLRLTFNDENFTNPTFSKVGSTPGGNCNFSPKVDTGFNGFLTRAFYFGNSHPQILDKRLTIDINPPTPADTNDLNTQIAMIENSGSHRLGTFKISGISNPSGTIGLKWLKGTNEWNTIVYTYDPESFITTIVDLETQDALNTALPVELISFEAVAIDNKASQLSWQTGSEINSEGFEIERQKEPNQWQKIGFTPSKGTGQNDYYFIDPSPKTGTNYYRLKQIDVDGKYEFSPIVSVDFVPSAGLLYPNPTAGVLYIDGYPDKGYEVFDVTSKILQQGVVNQKSIDVRTLSNGMYFLKIDGTTFRFIKW